MKCGASWLGALALVAQAGAQRDRRVAAIGPHPTVVLVDGDEQAPSGTAGSVPPSQGSHLIAVVVVNVEVQRPVGIEPPGQRLAALQRAAPLDKAARCGGKSALDIEFGALSGPSSFRQFMVTLGHALIFCRNALLFTNDGIAMGRHAGVTASTCDHRFVAPGHLAMFSGNRAGRNRFLVVVGGQRLVIETSARGVDPLQQFRGGCVRCRAHVVRTFAPNTFARNRGRRCEGEQCRTNGGNDDSQRIPIPGPLQRFMGRTPQRAWRHRVHDAQCRNRSPTRR